MLGRHGDHARGARRYLTCQKRVLNYVLFNRMSDRIDLFTDAICNQLAVGVVTECLLLMGSCTPNQQAYIYRQPRAR